MKTILITGGAGYIGSVITALFLNEGYHVKVADLLWFNKYIPSLYEANPNYTFIKGDIRDIDFLKNIMENVDYVIHAAAVVGDPASKKFPELTYTINQEASIKLIDMAKNYNIRGFIFLSTCSNYGISEGLANEDSILKPLSLYSETKVNVERYLIDKAHKLDWIICRLSTVYGVSPRMRFDLTVNDFALNAFTKKFLDIFLPYTHRPYIHVSDVGKVMLNIMEKFDITKRNIFNVGFNKENYQKIEIAKAISTSIPGIRIDITEKGSDTRDYRVDFSKLQRYLDVSNSYRVEDGIREVVDLLRSGKIHNPQDTVYYNTSPDLGVLNR